MRKMWMTASLLAVTLAAATAVKAAPIVVDFEGVTNGAGVDQFYNGGTDTLGASGPNLGVSFSSTALGLVDADAGGGGNFANEPSPNTILFFLDANSAVLNYAAGFDTGFSFFYTSSTAADVNVYDGLNATGNLLATIHLNAQFTDNCTGDPSGTFCNFTAVGVAFNGIAKSIDFGGTANQTGYDNITFGSAVPIGGDVPEPAAWALMITGFGLAGASLRRRRSIFAA